MEAHKKGNYGRAKYFILFDLNGTLLYKTPKKLKCSQEPNKSIKKSGFIYIRPNIAHLLISLLAKPYIRIGVYSSMKTQTVSKIVEAILENINALEKKDSILIFDRSCCDPDPNGENVTDTLKNLERVWEREFAKKLGMNSRNTILVENDIRKSAKSLSNLVRMVPYQESDIMNPNIEKDEILIKYAEYLERLIMSDTENVQEYIKVNKLPVEIEKYFEKSTEELVKAQEEFAKISGEGKQPEPEIKWVQVSEIVNKEEKMKEMMSLINSIKLKIEKQD